MLAERTKPTHYRFGWVCQRFSWFGSDTRQQGGNVTTSPAAPVADLKPTRSRLRSRRWQLLGLALVVVLVGGGLIGVRALTATPASTETVWQTIMSGIKDGTVPKDVALEAFAYQYRVSIPGVTVPQGVDGGDVPTSGTGSLRWVLNHWDELTADQQAIINRLTTPGQNDVILHIDATKGATAQPKIQLAAARIPAAGAAGAARAPSPGLQDAMEAEIAKIILHIGPMLGMPVITHGSGWYTNVSLDLSYESGGIALMETFTGQNKVHTSPCDITAYVEAWQNESPTASGGVSDNLRVELTHEVVHCYQKVIFGDQATAKDMPSWITEGTATWLAADDTGLVEPQLPGVWSNGYFKPERALTDRTYDAVGYYALLANLGRDLWGLMRPAWTAAAKGPDRSEAFIAVLRGDDQDVHDAWAATYLNQESWGAAWKTPGFGIPAAAQVVRHPIQAQSSPGTTGTLLERSNTVLSVTSAAGEVAIVSTSGMASAHDESGNNALPFQTRRFCVSGECICPPGTPLAGKKPTDQAMTMPFALALNAPLGGSKYSVVGSKLADLCGSPPSKSHPGNGGPCASNCSNSNGDPHMLTVNNYRYDFQGAGEFTLLRSGDDTFEVQSRQEPYGTAGKVATNTAIAAKVGSHRVGVYVTPNGLEARLDGTALDLSSPKDLGGGAAISTYPKGFEIDFPDGTRLWALSVGKYGINAVISPSDSLRASGVGLLGRIIPGGLGVPALPDGTRLPAAKDRHQRHDALYGQFADAWRVADKTSLFDYDTGKTTTTYTQKSYPADTADVQFSDLTSDQRAAGDAACTAITDQQLRDSCSFDVGVSGESGFADGYQATQGLLDSVVASPSESPGPYGSTTPRTPPPGKIAGATAIAKVTGLKGYAVGPDDKLYVSVALDGGKAAIIEIDPATGAIVHQIDVPNATDIHVAAGSVWASGLGVDQATGIHPCSVTRFDAQTLAAQSTIAIPYDRLACPLLNGPSLASDGSAVWFEDLGKWDGTAGATLTRIDPATNQLGASVPLPFINGQFQDSQGALFYFGATPTRGFYRLTTGGTAMELMGPWSAKTAFGGTGIWVQAEDFTTAQFIAGPGSTTQPIQVGGPIVAGTSQAVIAEVQAPDGTGQLWIYPANGSTPTQLATAPTIDGTGLAYFGDPGAIVAPHGVIKLWLPDSNGQPTKTLYFQWTPLP
jgi:hypothetical protein